jgi:hypothetical protein
MTFQLICTVSFFTFLLCVDALLISLIFLELMRAIPIWSIMGS